MAALQCRHTTAERTRVGDIDREEREEERGEHEEEHEEEREEEHEEREEEREEREEGLGDESIC